MDGGLGDVIEGELRALVGTPLWGSSRVTVAEPLELLPGAGDMIIEGEAVTQESTSMRLVVRSNPVEVGGKRVTWMRLAPRYEGDSFHDLGSEHRIIVSGDLRSAEGSPDALSFIGDVQVPPSVA